MFGHEFFWGVNLAWFDGEYAHDLGPEPQHPEYAVWYDPVKVSLYLRGIKDIGFQVVRFWLMERAEGWCVDADGIVTGLHDTFLRNLDDLVQRATNVGLRHYLCFTEKWDEVSYPSPVQDHRQQVAYLDRAVRGQDTTVGMLCEMAITRIAVSTSTMSTFTASTDFYRQRWT